MRIPAPGSGHCARAAFLGLILSLCAGAAASAPAGEIDPVLNLLVDRGLAAAERAVPATPPKDSAGTPPGILRNVHDRASSMVGAAMNFIGVRYRAGGNSADSGFDCSGFTRHIFEMSLGLVLPRSADEQAVAPGLVAVRRDDLKPGDLVFFNTLRRTFSHVGIYIGENRFIHAPRSGKLVRTDDMSFAYWSQRFTGARRVLAAAPTQDGALPLTDLRSVPASH
jgi:cell wall-associated NlpC family hydrolase